MRLEVIQFCLFKVIFKLMQQLFLILTNMGTHLSKCFCNRIRQDGTILPRNSKLETILLFSVVQNARSSKLLGASTLYPHQTPALDPMEGLQRPRPLLDKAVTYGPDRTDRANTFFIHILAGSYVFADLWRQGSRLFFGSKNESAPALLYSKYCMAP